VFGVAAYQAALRLLPAQDLHPGMKVPPWARWNPATGAWAVDHVAAMRLWSPADGVRLPPPEMVDAFLTGYVERTGDEGARRLVEQLYAEAEQRLVERGGAPETVAASTLTEAAAVAERHGYGEHVETVVINPWSRGFGTAVAFAVPPAVFGIWVLVAVDGDVLALVGGILLTALAAGLLALAVVALRQREPTPQRLFLFTGGVVLGVGGVLEPYAWPDLEVVVKTVVSTVGSGQNEVRQRVIMIGPVEQTAQYPIPSSHHRTVVTLARAGGASFR
jgi:hypothetical protein